MKEMQEILGIWEIFFPAIFSLEIYEAFLEIDFRRRSRLMKKNMHHMISALAC